MDIIVSHQLTDFDGLGAMVAAQKLFPEARAVFVGRLHRLVKDFMALYRDEINVDRLKDIELDEVTRVIVVDTHERKLLGQLNDSINWDEVEVIMYDHHHHQKLEWVDLDFSREVGSATTILVNRIEDEGIKLNPLEATLFALAIHADTGNLTYLNTRSADARAFAFLLGKGANLKLVNEFLVESLNDEQDQLLENLLNKRRDIKIDGVEVSLFACRHDKYTIGINKIVEKLKAVYQITTIFALIEMDEKVEIVGRSSDEAVDIGKICSLLGGGGHAGAGAASAADELELVEKKLIDLIKENVMPVKKVREIMSSPVRTVSPGTKIEEVENFLKKYGHTGLIVCDNDRLVGVFSLRDLNKVKGYGLLHAPVKGYMSRNVITVGAEAPVQQAQELMVKYNIGRLPVLEDDRLVGIITRSDVLASYYGGETPHQHQNRYGSSLVKIIPSIRDISSRLNSLPELVLEILREIKLAAAEYGVKIYLIGGMVRDLFLERENRDLDLVVDGRLQELVPVLASKLAGKWSYNEQFKTANIVLEDGYNLDFATARKEKYHTPGGLPRVEPADILEDLFRRDYTVNVLALGLYGERWGKLIDYFQGLKDLERRKLRVLHRFSFLDDPTRILRGVRLAAQLGFTFEAETCSLIKEALEMGDFSKLTSGRVLKEFKNLFQNKVTGKLFELLKKLPVFNLLGLEIEIKETVYSQLEELEGYLEYLRQKNYNIEEWLLRLAVFLSDLPLHKIEEWEMCSPWKKILTIFNRIKAGEYINKLNQSLDPVQLYKLLSDFSAAEIVLIGVKAGSNRAEMNLKKYFEDLSQVELEINGFDLQELGLKPGPEIKVVLEQVFNAKLRGEVKNRREEIKLAESLINEFNNNL